MSGAAVQIVDDLRQFSDSEIIVIDDGSSHDHTQRLVGYLNGVNEFVLHANDLFDVIVFNRVFAFARGKYIAVMQDDDKYKGKDWVTRAVGHLDWDPKLAILGGRMRITLPKDGKARDEGAGVFQYVQAINASPMWIRREAFLELGGFDIDFAPMLWHEPAFCLKAWLSGYHVGWYKSGIRSCAIPTRQRRNVKEELTRDARKKNYELLMERYGDKLDGIRECVERMNQ
jgi:GT2 family glycosyltransferase